MKQAWANWNFARARVFTYLFDFGDMWWFDIKVIQIAEGAVPKPVVIKAEGKAPEQYPISDW